MFTMLPIAAAEYVVNPLPPREVVQAPELDVGPSYEAPWHVLSLLHSARAGRPGWADDLERLPTMTELDFESLVVEILGAVKSEQLRPLVKSWAASVRAARATEPVMPASLAA